MNTPLRTATLGLALLLAAATSHAQAPTAASISSRPPKPGLEAQAEAGTPPVVIAPRTRSLVVPKTNQPSIQVVTPTAPGEAVSAPVRIELAFKPAPGTRIVPSTFRVLYGLLKIDLTDRLKKHATVTEEGVVVDRAQVPDGPAPLVHAGHRRPRQPGRTGTAVARGQRRLSVPPRYRLSTFHRPPPGGPPMPTPFAAPALALLFCGVLAAWPGPTAATEADTQKMIEALMPTATRSLRNLVVRQKLEPAVSTAPAAQASGAAMRRECDDGRHERLCQRRTRQRRRCRLAAPAAAAVSAPATVAAEAPTRPPPPGPAPSLALSIHFEPNSARVRAESGPLLGSLVAALQSPELKGNRFIIEGHADARGVAERNLRLSQERADEVRLYLVALGVHPSRLRAVGRGNSQPANAGDPAAAQNRRVRVVTVE